MGLCPITTRATRALIVDAHSAKVVLTTNQRELLLMPMTNTVPHSVTEFRFLTSRVTHNSNCFFLQLFIWNQM